MTLRIAESLTDEEEKVEMYSKFTKTELIKMLIRANEHIDKCINKTIKG
jgi:hypothetical protein